MTRKKWIGGNWKMNGVQASVSALVQAIRQGVASQPVTAEIVLFPAFLHLLSVRAALQNTAIFLGAQNLYPAAAGAFTGEVSAAMLKDVGCQYVLVGHSERRQLFRETSEEVAVKFQVAAEMGLCPVLCVGETAAERAAQRTEEVIAAQLAPVLARAGQAAFQQAVIAYEPVWAIGTGVSATPAQAQAVHVFIRDWLAKECDEAFAKTLRIVYGGSVKADNAAELFAMSAIDGALVGGASLKAEDFLAICAAAG